MNIREKMSKGIFFFYMGKFIGRPKRRIKRDYIYKFYKKVG